MRRRFLKLFVLLSLLVSSCSFAAPKPAADSVIFIIGDGMGPNQVELARIAGGGDLLAFQRFPYSGVVTTLNVDKEVTDSAAAATALATGVKTKNGMVGVSPGGQRLETLLERCQQQKKATGLITTDPIWGATPSGFAAHVGSRGEYAEIARQLTESKVQVLMGYGVNQMTPKAAGGARNDDLDLLSSLRTKGYDVVTTREELSKATRPSLAGFFVDDKPSLPEMTKTALSRLEKSPKGFFLMVEEYGPDGAGHSHNPVASVRAVRSVNETVQVAVDFARRRGRTLVVVTADHDTGGLMIDAPARAALLGKVTGTPAELAAQLSDNRANAPMMLKGKAGIEQLSKEELDQIRTAKDPAEYIKNLISARAGLRWTGEGNHTATPVRVYAFGPGADRFAGELDNTQLPKFIAEALGLGTFPK